MIDVHIAEFKHFHYNRRHTHHEKVSRQVLLAKVVVSQIENLEHWKSAKTARKYVEPVHAYIEDPELRHLRQRHWQLGNVIVEQVEYLQVD